MKRVRIHTPVSDTEIAHACCVIRQKHGCTLAPEALRKVSDLTDRYMAEGKPFSEAMELSIQTNLPERQRPGTRRKQLLEDGTRIILARRHAFAVKYAEAQGWTPPVSPFRKESIELPVRTRRR